VSAALVVIAKAPVPGRVKTRLCPPCTPAEAADLAAAALRDTLDAVRATPAARRVLVLDGPSGPWAAGLEVVGQRGAGLAARLANAFADVGAPALMIGMDTPHVTPELLTAGLAALRRRPAVLGPADDGGYWAIGLRRPDARVFAGVPMSRATTGARQLERLRALGLDVERLPALRDVDDIGDALAVAALAPASRFAAALAAQARTAVAA
jgi:rSAM/selenodomain-associated transferase 1